jgi:hypothetical protein
VKPTTHYSAKSVTLKQQKLNAFSARAVTRIDTSRPSVVAPRKLSNADFEQWKHALRHPEMFDFFKNFLRGTNSTEVEQQLAKTDGPVTWGNPHVEVYEAYRGVVGEEFYLTSDGITITFEGLKLQPHTQWIVLTDNERVLRHHGDFSAESIGLALLKWRNA